jgi:hypothetical protein
MKTITATNIQWIQADDARLRALAYLSGHMEEPRTISEMGINDEIVQERQDLPYEVTIEVEDYADDDDIEDAIVAEAGALYHYVESCNLL